MRGLARSMTLAVSAVALISAYPVMAAPAVTSDPVPDTRNGSTSTAGQTTNIVGPALKATPPGQKNVAVTFSEYELETPISRQYNYQGIRFSNPTGGPNPFISADASNPTAPVLSGTPQFQGGIRGTFVEPGTNKQRLVDRFSLDVGYINDPGAVKMNLFAANGRKLGTVQTTEIGINHLVSDVKGVASFVVRAEAQEGAGFAIDNVVPFLPRSRIAAIGDSYSSGEGNGPFYDAYGGCHVSPAAWPNLMVSEHKVGTLVSNLACSGATTAAMNNTFKNQPPQLDRLSALDGLNPVDVVTVTLAGNDVKFDDVIRACFLRNCSGNGRLAEAELDILDLAATMPSQYDAIQSAAPSAKLFVVGYPRLFSKQRHLERLHCPWLNANEQEGMNILAGELNDVLKQAARTAGAAYVPTMGALNRHELCTGDPWIHSVGLPVQLSAHPLLPGQRAISELVLTAIRG